MVCLEMTEHSENCFIIFSPRPKHWPVISNFNILFIKFYLFCLYTHIYICIYFLLHSAKERDIFCAFLRNMVGGSLAWWPSVGQWKIQNLNSFCLFRLSFLVPKTGTSIYRYLYAAAFILGAFGAQTKSIPTFQTLRLLQVCF